MLVWILRYSSKQVEEDSGCCRSSTCFMHCYVLRAKQTRSSIPRRCLYMILQDSLTLLPQDRYRWLSYLSQIDHLFCLSHRLSTSFLSCHSRCTCSYFRLAFKPNERSFHGLKESYRSCKPAMLLIREYSSLSCVEERLTIRTSIRFAAFKSPNDRIRQPAMNTASHFASRRPDVSHLSQEALRLYVLKPGTCRKTY